MRTLRRVAADRDRGVHQQIEPVGALLHLWTALGEDGAIILAAGESTPRRIGETGQRRSRRRFTEMKRLVGVKILAADFRRDIAVADIGATCRCKSLGVAAGRQHAIAKDEIRLPTPAAPTARRSISSKLREPSG